ncbi:MAG: ACT domain-containing protein [Lachnospiraceae bacterium]|nr:ACT domain-containing protein [Lachnospiraceae bacterium]
MSIKQISVFMENKPGTLEEMTDVLAKNNIDMRAISVAEAEDFGIARLIVDDVYETATVLKDAGFVNKLSEVLAVEIPDIPGGLNKVLKTLSAAQVNLEYMYAFLGGKDVDKAFLIMKVAHIDRAESTLKIGGFNLVDQEHISEL